MIHVGMIMISDDIYVAGMLALIMQVYLLQLLDGCTYPQSSEAALPVWQSAGLPLRLHVAHSLVRCWACVLALSKATNCAQILHKDDVAMLLRKPDQELAKHRVVSMSDVIVFRRLKIPFNSLG